MATSAPALVNPTLLAWAREQSGCEPEPVAKRLTIKVDRLLAWERGDRISLKPLNSDFQPIVLTGADEQQIHVVAELVEVLTSEAAAP